MMKYNLVLCEIHLPAIHGKTKSSCPYIETHFLLISKFDGPSGMLLDEYNEIVEPETDTESDSDAESFASNLEDMEEDELTAIYQTQQLYLGEYNIMNNIRHPTIRNYNNIIHRENYIKPEIGHCIELPTGETIVIIKTMWLKIIQRKWKKVVSERKRILTERSHPNALYTRMITGNWPDSCKEMPKLYLFRN